MPRNTIRMNTWIMLWRFLSIQVICLTLRTISLIRFSHSCGNYSIIRLSYPDFFFIQRFPIFRCRSNIWKIVCGVAWYASFILTYVHSWFSGNSSNLRSICACLIRYLWVCPFSTSTRSSCRSSVNVTIYLCFTFHHPMIAYHILYAYATSIY